MMSSTNPLRTPTLDFIARLTVDVASPWELGESAHGQRRFIAITGGDVAGEQLNGRILAAGGDWQTIRTDGVAELYARYFLETDDGERIEVENTGFRHGPASVMQRLRDGEAVPPEDYYFHTAPRFFTTSTRLDWLNRTLFLGSAARTRDNVIIDLFAVG
ncbi:DUF3237 domain-containing protein [Chromohalobacter canadensis]|uniref:DUF3237 domain-containing protein n=1 Tax=Chromohalobacter canadensis TaxID=141389 RepID=UPI0021BEB93E|nr:DUF3237 domain-containing protein [Chromohalobacter canadensis]